MTLPDTYVVTGGTGESAVMRRVGGREYPLRSVKQCRVCSSPYRTEIENGLLKSYSYRVIAESLPDDSVVTQKSIRHHYKSGHMPLDESVRRVVIERHAEERGLDIQASEEALANYLTFAELGVQKVMQGMMSGEIVPDIKDAIALAGLLQKAEQVAGAGFDQEAITQAFMAYWRATQSSVSPEQLQEIGEKIASDPVMQALRARAAAGEVEAGESAE